MKKPMHILTEVSMETVEEMQRGQGVRMLEQFLNSGVKAAELTLESGSSVNASLWVKTYTHLVREHGLEDKMFVVKGRDIQGGPHCYFVRKDEKS